MNVFKGLLYLIENDPSATSARSAAPRYGAATAADEFARKLGNRAAAEHRFGSFARGAVPAEARLEALGGCG